ncbi:hypothetical protein FV226_12260 [Methylobacterium sp. WL12]|uniref:DUF6634 family protein n=1 Tax=Methylobacterium sp. WL12 TaxID=2603890 RepID=UPI0011C915A5|nr:DUF6634 family protein [Methylobacterium sp. WL12]TXM72455.1 hypothetical protein FV226_12260 [Methylobacterium sp. WL12]
MRLKVLNSFELQALERRRAKARETLAQIQAGWVPNEAALAEAPFLDDWSVRPYPGTDLPSLVGNCWGHPTLGNRWIGTSPIQHLGDGYAVTQKTLYILGREHTASNEARLDRILSGRRGRGREACPEPDFDDETEVKP